MSEIFGFDAFSPAQIAARVENVGVAKTRLPLLSLLMLSVLAGAFIGLGALGFVLVKSDPSLGFATSQLLGGLTFSLGLILVVVAGAELFTGNNLLALAWADGKISTRDVLRNWAIVCTGNFIGAGGLALLVFLSHHPDMNNGAIAKAYLQIAAAKVALPFWTAFFRGILCNVLVCMAMWMVLAGRSVLDKVVAVVFPISAFVAAGFEHSIANMYLIPLAMLLQTFDGAQAANGITWLGFIGNLAPVILGNIIGGAGMVAATYWFVYLRKSRAVDAHRRRPGTPKDAGRSSISPAGRLGV